jgi:type I restriction enzyme S subunit
MKNSISVNKRWCSIALCECCAIYQPQTISKKEMTEDGEYPVFGANGLIGMYHEYNHEYPQLLITCRGATCGSVNISKPKSWITGNAMVVKPHSNYLNEQFLKYFFIGFDFSTVISGSAQPQITRASLSPVEVPLPPRGAPHRISAPSEELFSELDAGVENLIKAKEQLGVYRQSLLKHAFEGELTEEWRKENADKLESGEALLKRVKKEREEYFKKQLEQWEKDVAQWEADGKPGKKPTKPKKPKKLAPISEEELMELPELPEGWVWVRLGEIGLVTGGLTKNKQRMQLQTQKPYLRVANVYENELRLDEILQIGLKNEEVSRYLLRENDLLIVEGNGSLEQIGRMAIWDGSINGCVHQNHIIKARFTEETLPTVVLYWCMSSHGREMVKKQASSTAGLYTLSISKVSSIPIPIMPINEAKEIIKRIQVSDISTKETAEVIEDNVKSSSMLQRAILVKAFSGELVPQDPNDEPASKLLEKIKQERKSAPKPKRTRKKSQATA